MQAKEAADILGISPRMLRHYEKEGLLEVTRDANGYRRYAPADLRRAGRIRDFIATGFSTREVRDMLECLTDNGSGPCTAGIGKLEDKLAHVDRLAAELSDRRSAIIARIGELRRALAANSEPDLTTLPRRVVKGG